MGANLNLMQQSSTRGVTNLFLSLPPSRGLLTIKRHKYFCPLDVRDGNTVTSEKYRSMPLLEDYSILIKIWYRSATMPQDQDWIQPQMRLRIHTPFFTSEMLMNSITIWIRTALRQPVRCRWSNERLNRLNRTTGAAAVAIARLNGWKDVVISVAPKSRRSRGFRIFLPTK